ncbi:TB2/DP1, HVA22 family-domain-containing protein [Mycena alexandri]|uniref:Protein YOP1 n=1 Tax=Mycena alexandri TaxID=1745969 RepID=A0AAD6XBY9_9AGAR|nr:TB2/DP1, HVA22 family-domain-containing protein [Mycena alexandri]
MRSEALLTARADGASKDGLAAWFAFLLPVFGTYKALSHRPVSEPELERWSQYWAVIGVLVAYEYLFEFLVSWFPFYWELKTLFLLFLALPQTQGSTFIYQMYLQPFFTKNETELDAGATLQLFPDSPPELLAGIMSIQRKTLSFAQARFATLWQAFWSAINKNPAAGQQAPATPGQAPPAPGAGLSLESAMGLFRTYGPSLMSAFQPAAAPPAGPSPAPSPLPTPAAEHRAPPFPEPQLLS